MDDDVRDVARVGDAREERHVALAAALEHEDPLLVGVDAERVEERAGTSSFSVRPSTRTAQRARKSSARSLSNSESARNALRLRERLGLVERRAAGRRVADERELLELVDAEEDRRVRRVEDLVPLLRERAQDAVEVPLRMRAEVELRLLDQEHEVAEVRGEQALHARHEREAAVRRGPVVIDESAA